MGRPTKKIDDAFDADALLGEIAYVRSPIWQNGSRTVAAIITEASADAGIVPEGALAIVTLTAFPPGAPSRMMRDVPFYRAAPSAELLPAAWLKRKD